MDEVRQSVPLERRRDGSPARVLADQRDQIKRYLAELSESADAAEREIADSVRQLLADVAAERENGPSKRDVARLAERAEQLKSREQELDAQRRDLERREAAVAEAGRQKTRYEERLHRLEQREEELESERQRTKSQRRRIAAELKDERETVRREARRAAEETESAREELRRRHEDGRRRAAELERREADLKSAAADGDVQLRAQVRSLESLLTERNAALAEIAAETDDLRERLADYKSRLAETEARLGEAAARRNDDDETADLRRRLEEAQETVRDLKIRCAALERSQAAGSSAVAAGEVPMDWESQKRRLLAALDAVDPRDPARADLPTIEGTIRITDNVVAEKDREIEALQLRVEELSRGEPTVAESLIDQDEFIARHRAEAERLRDEWSEKLRVTEIELSLERAKLARERTDLEEQRAEFEAQQARCAKDAVVAPKAAGETQRKTGGGRWLARLGLRENTDE